jgi:hypothetical protein
MELFLVQRTCACCGDVEDCGIFSSLEMAKKGIRQAAGARDDVLDEFHEEEWIWDTDFEFISYFITEAELDKVLEPLEEEYKEQDEQ